MSRWDEEAAKDLLKVSEEAGYVDEEAAEKARKYLDEGKPTEALEVIIREIKST